MEIIRSTYHVIREVYDSSKARVLIAKEYEGGKKIINMIKDISIIEDYLNDSDVSTDFFVYDGLLCITADYYEGIDVHDYLDQNPSQIMKLSLDITIKILTELLPMSLLYTLIDCDCICVSDKGVHINRYFRFISSENNDSECDVVLKVQDLLLLCLEECPLDYTQRFNLREYQNGLNGSFNSMMDLYLFVKKYADSYEPMESKDILRQHIDKTQEYLVSIQERAMPAIIILSCLFFIILLYIQILRPTDYLREMQVSRVGGIQLNENGSIVNKIFNDDIAEVSD